MDSVKVSIVVIGFNEGCNLQDTFKAIKDLNYPKNNIEIIYCDTGSTDNSVNIAKKYTNKVFIEKNKWPTPGLARNRGLLEIKHDIVHFIDGDIQINKNYLKKAVEKIQKPGVDAVYGYLEEESYKSINKILLAHWSDRKEGYHNATGGGGTYKKSVLLSLDGYDERIRKGQETELGERYLSSGYKIWFMNEPMGIHNYNVNTFKDLIKIYFLDGINKSHLHLTKGNTEFYYSSKKFALNNLSFCIIFLVALFFLMFKFGPLGLFLSLGIYYSYFIIKYMFIKKIKQMDILKYYFIMYSMKLITFSGQLKFYLKCLLDKNYHKSVIKSKQELKQ